MVESFITSNNFVLFNDIRLMLVSSGCQDDINFFYSYVDIDKQQAKDICIKTLNQTRAYWHKVRQLRITETSAYSFFTYSKGEKKDWDTKVKSLLFPKFSGNSATWYGQKK